MFGPVCALGSHRGTLPGLLGALLAGLLPCAAHALEPGQRFDQYAHAAWPSVAHASTVFSLLPAPDGRLWVGTSEGVVRFEGLRLVPLDPQRFPGIVDRDVRGLQLGRDGTLWIASWGRGLSRVRDEQVLASAGVDGSRTPAGAWVSSFLEDGGGTMWVASRNGVFRFAPGATAAVPSHDGLVHRCTHHLLLEPGGGPLWAATHVGVARWDGKRWQPEAGPAAPIKPGASVDVLLAAGGTLWAGTRGDGLWRRQQGHGAAQWTRFTTESGLGSNEVTALLADRRGRVWVATRGGHLAWLDGERFRPFALPPRLCGDRIQALAEDGEGGLWIGTDRCGLHRLADRPFQRLTVADGLPSEAVLGLMAGPDGEVVAGTRGGGLARRAPGASLFQPLTCAAGLPCDECWDFSRHRAVPGAFWTVCRQNVVLRWDGRQMVRHVPLPGELAASSFTLEASDGAVWFTLDGKVVRSHAGVVTTLPEQEPLQGYRILFEARDGTIWIAAADGLTRWRQGRSELIRLPSTERPAEVASFLEDSAGTLWMATKGEGIRRLRAGRISTIGVGQGLPTGWIVQLLEDGRGRLWASSSKGIFWVDWRELDQVADGRQPRVHPSLYDASDGVQIRAESFGHPAGFRDPRGRLWFATNAGIVAVDPAESRAGPRVQIGELRLGGQRIDLTGHAAATVTGVRRDLDVTFSALSFEPADAIAYRYRLQPEERGDETGSDSGWVEIGPNRTLHEAALTPARYRLSIAARTRESNWSAQPLALAFRVVPPLHRSPAFWGPLLVLLALAGAVSLRALHRMRIARAQAALRTVMDERSRIAREIHDTLAQAFVATSVQLECLEEALEPERKPGTKHDTGREGKIRRHLDIAKKVVEESLEEARRAVWVLRPQAIEPGLVPALQTLVGRLSGGTAVELKVTGTPRELPPLVASNLLRIAHEALANAHRHAGARRIEVRLAYAPGSVNLTVADDGRGLAAGGGPGAAPGTGPGTGHGILGMQERAAQMGGNLSIAGGPAAGTTVAVEVAA